MTTHQPLRGYPDPEQPPLSYEDYRSLIPAEPYDPPGGSAAEKETSLRELAARMLGTVDDDENPSIPAAYTYLGQFISHDVTFGSATPTRSQGAGANLRTPGLDLDSVYGREPSERPELYVDPEDGRPGYELRLGKAFLDERHLNHGEPDLPRSQGPYARLGVRFQEGGGRRHVASVLETRATREAGDGGDGVEPIVTLKARTRPVPVPEEDVIHTRGIAFVPVHGTNRVRTDEGWQRVDSATVLRLGSLALVGDPRNDQNVMVSQLHLAFLRLHNAALRRALERRPNAGLAAFQEARREVRWHFQWLVVHDYLKRVLGEERWEIQRAALLPEDHSSPQGALYSWQDGPFVPKEFALAGFRFGHAMVRPSYRLNELPPSREIPLLVQKPNPLPKADLRGFKILPDRWTVQWNLFLPVGGSVPQASRALQPTLSPPMAERVAPLSGTLEPLPYVTLHRGWTHGLPSGQAAARALDIEVLEGNDPLWLYVLKEAREQAGGRHLGALGARIVGETLFGLVREHPGSYYRARSPWKPSWGTGGDFDLADLLRMGESPFTLQDVEEVVFRSGTLAAHAT